MDFIYNNELLSHWLLHYGSITLFVLLVLGIIALPVPEETLMIVAGVLMSKGSLNIPFTILAAYAGSMCGISLSYLIGRTAGYYVIHQYGSWVGLKAKHLDQAEKWFEHFGKWTLLIGYFIPGLRHFTGFSAGVTKLPFNEFALFAYMGAVLWVTTFLSLGYFCGEYCFAFFEKLDVVDTIIILGIFAILLYIAFLKLKQYFRHE